MPNKKLRIQQTDIGNLISNLRGEIGDITTTWVLYRIVRAQAASQLSGDVTKDLADRSLAVLHMIGDKLRDAIIAQLSELAQKKIGRLNFHFASVKLNAFERETAEFYLHGYTRSHHQATQTGRRDQRANPEAQ